MKALVRFRRTLAAVVAVAALTAFTPPALLAGGCEDPGYVGSNCANKDSTTFVPPIARPAPGKGKKDRSILIVDAEMLHAWLAVFLSRVIR